MPKNPETSGRVLDEGTWNQFVPGDPATPADDSSGRKNNVSGHSVGPKHEGPKTIPVPEATPTPHSSHGKTNPAAPDSADSDEVTPKPGSERSDEWDVLPAPKIEKGELIFGKYLLEAKLGEGGMGQVWRVENVMLQRESALKLIRPEIAQNDKGWKRFEREARLMAKITHHNAVGVYDFRRSQSMGYIEMELVPGINLHDFLKQRRGEPLPLDWVARFLDQLCSVLQEAHGHVDKKSGKAKPIVHRDLKPSNLMLVEGKAADENLKVLDFGIAKIAEDDGNPELTGQGDFLGTPDYMSPEQIRGGITREGRGGIDGRSDLYSVGVLLYQLITGSLPFQGMNRMSVLAAHLHGTIPAMKETNPAVRVPPQVERLVLKCLEKDPDKRPQTARELAQQFRAAMLSEEHIVPARPHWRKAAAVVLAVALLFAAVPVVQAIRKTIENRGHTGGERAPKVVDRTPPGSEPPKGNETSRRSPTEALPSPFQGYLVADNVKLPKDSPPGTTGLRRTSDDVEFYPLKTGAYLPVGYGPDPNDTDDLVEVIWPRVIVRTSDSNVRFIRIPSKTYRRGDPHNKPGTEPQQWVRVSGFYIQETEVTNGEIEAYLESNFEAQDDLRNWRDYFKSLRATVKPVERAKRFPAACISYLAAERFARAVGGRLPSEAEWEFVAKSGNDDNIFPWGKQLPNKNEPLKANILSPAHPSKGRPTEVQTFPGDKQDDGVFDMAGNVREFCLDVFKPYPVPPENSPRLPLIDPRIVAEPQADRTTRYVVRGGGCYSSLQKATAFHREGVRADESAADIGFRLVIECPPVPSSSY
jgi:serine/threonine-protein kinase